MPWWIPYLIGGLTTALFSVVGKLLYDGIKSKSHGDYENGNAGDKSAAWWEKTFRKIVEDVMHTRNETLENLVRRVIREELDRDYRRTS